MAVSQADKARIAHRVLRLRENGVDSESAVRGVASMEPPPGAASRPGALIGGAGHPLAGVARWVGFAQDPDAPGPTDTRLVERLMGLSVEDIYKTWGEATLANLEENHPEDFAAAQESWERAEAIFREDVETMEATGDWPTSAVFGHNRLPNLANALYDKGREAFLGGDLDWDANDIRIVLLDSADYTVNLGTHEFLSDVPAAARVAASAAGMTGKTKTAGVADADDVTLAAVAGDPSEALLFYSHTGGADTARRLIGYIDTATGLPVTPNGGDITIQWDAGANRIFKL